LNAVGQCSVAADQAGSANFLAARRVTQTFPIVYTFTGFLRPVFNPPTVNVASAGTSIPVRFSLGGNEGLSVLASGSPTSASIVCVPGAPLHLIDEFEVPGPSRLVYNKLTNRYIYIWQTIEAWGGTCRKLTVTLADGTVHTAVFRFTR
jgi:hypothetical protein